MAAPDAVCPEYLLRQVLRPARPGQQPSAGRLLQEHVHPAPSAVGRRATT